MPRSTERQEHVAGFPPAAGRLAVVSGLEPGRKRGHRQPLLARMLWGIAIGFALAMVVALVLR